MDGIVKFFTDLSATLGNIVDYAQYASDAVSTYIPIFWGPEIGLALGSACALAVALLVVGR